VRQSWLSPSAEPRPADEKGTGVFAIEDIAAGTTVAAFGGIVVTGSEMRALGERVCAHALQIDEDLFLASVPPFDPADYVNHSCDPNCGIVGAVLLVTRRAVEAGEELCFDYAMTDSDDYDEFTCACRTPECRGVVRGTDWKRSELQERYAGWFSSYLARCMQ
jgi:SET domain-containing protein